MKRLTLVLVDRRYKNAHTYDDDEWLWGITDWGIQIRHDDSRVRIFFPWSTISYAAEEVLG